MTGDTVGLPKVHLVFTEWRVTRGLVRRHAHPKEPYGQKGLSQPQFLDLRADAFYMQIDVFRDVSFKL